MKEPLDEIIRRLSQLRELSLDNLRNVVDILLVAYLAYRLLQLIRTSRAWRILIGIVVFVGALFVSDLLQLRTLHWILDKATILAPVALVILLLPELRHTLEGLSRLGFLPERINVGSSNLSAHTLEEVVAAVSELCAGRIGAIIVIERSLPMNDIAANGVAINALVSVPLLGSIFYEGNPLHDGAVIIRGDMIVAAACRLPLSENNLIDKSVHMRHRAALGISEQSDCLAVIVSEEKGSVSVAVDGELNRLSGPAELREFLNGYLRVDSRQSRRRRKEKVETKV